MGIAKPLRGSLAGLVVMGRFRHPGTVLTAARCLDSRWRLKWRTAAKRSRNRPRRSGRNCWKQPASMRQPARWQCSPRAKATSPIRVGTSRGQPRPTHPPSRHRHTFLEPRQICFPLYSDPNSPGGTRRQGRVKCARLRFSWSLRSACRLVPIRPSRPTGAAARRLSSQA